MSKREKRLLESPLIPLGELPKIWDPDEGKVVSAEEMLASKGAMVMNDKGSVRGKFRYFVVLGIEKAAGFNEQALREALKNDVCKTAAEVERCDISTAYILLTLLIAPLLAPLDYISDLLGRCKRAGLSLYRGFFIANGTKPSAREIAAYLKDFKPAQKS